MLFRQIQPCEVNLSFKSHFDFLTVYLAFNTSFNTCFKYSLIFRSQIRLDAPIYSFFKNLKSLENWEEI